MSIYRFNIQCTLHIAHVKVAVNFFLQLNFILAWFLGMAMYDNEFKTKEE